MDKKIKVIFFGTPQFVVPVLKKLQDNFSLVGVVTAPDKKVGRTQLLTPSPVKLASQGLALEPSPAIITPEKFDEEMITQIKNLEPDLIVVAAYGHLIPQIILDIPKFRSLNVHPSLLPKYRGPSPIQNTILNGEKITGVTIIKMDEKMDHGPILYTKEISLSGQDNFETLSKKLFELGADLLIQIIPDFVAGKLKPKEQNHSKATFTHIIKKEDGYFDINNPPSPKILDRMIRAYYPWPTAWTHFRQGSSGQSRIVKFLPASSHPELTEGHPELVSGSIKFLVQMEGKKPVTLEDFLRGHPTFLIKNL